MEITLAAFLKEERARLKRFEADWREQHAKNPEHYPLRCEASDFDEALMTFAD